MATMDVIGSGLVYVTGAVIVGGGGYYLRNRREDKSHSMQLVVDVKEIKTALVGALPTSIVPHPGPGIIQRLDDYNVAMKLRTDMGDTLIAAFAAQETVVHEIKRSLCDVTAATISSGIAIKDLQSQMALAVSNAEVAAAAAAKTADATQANTKKNGGQSTSVGDMASRTEEGLNDLVTRLEKSGVIEKKENHAPVSSLP